MFGECSWTYRGRARRSATSYQSKPSLIFAQPSFERLIAKARELDEQAQAMSCFAESSIAGRMGCIGLWHLTSVPSHRSGLRGANLAHSVPYPSLGQSQRIRPAQHSEVHHALRLLGVLVRFSREEASTRAVPRTTSSSNGRFKGLPGVIIRWGRSGRPILFAPPSSLGCPHCLGPQLLLIPQISMLRTSHCTSLSLGS